MFADEFRQNLRNFNTDREVFRLEKFFGKRPAKSSEEIREIYSDLFTPATIGSLEKLLENSSDQTETERTGRRNLLNIARTGYLQYRTDEISREIERCREAVRISFQNETLPAGVISARIGAGETSFFRREIFERWMEAESSCADLVRDRFRQLQENALTLGFANLHQLYAGISQVDLPGLAREAETFLNKTEEPYFDLLARLSAEQGLETRRLTFADNLFLFEKLDRRDLFKGEDLPFFYIRILENFGFSPGRIPQIKLKKAAGPGGVFVPKPAEEVFLCPSGGKGLGCFRTFLENFGSAQKFAWTSPNLVEKHPEFVFAPDDVPGRAYGFLFQMLLADESFMRRHFSGQDEKLIKILLRESRFRDLFRIRREARRFLAETEVFVTGDFEDISRRAAGEFTNDLGFEFDPEQLFLEISTEFSAQKNLRGLIFAAGLREYLRERYDFQWWDQPKAFEELIDLWNTADRYGAEELAQLVGFEMNFELLAESFLE